jgi:hypothetical protein
MKLTTFIFAPQRGQVEWYEDKRIGGFAAIVTRSVSED